MPPCARMPRTDQRRSHLTGICLALVAGGLSLASARAQTVAGNAGDAFPTEADPRQVKSLHEHRARLDATVWAAEEQAQRYEEIFIRLWDDLRNLRDRWGVLERFPFQSLTAGRAGEPANLGHSIRRTLYTDPDKAADAKPLSWTHAMYVEQIELFRNAGWEIEQTEWHHGRFVPPTDEAPASSTMSFVFDARNDGTRQRASLKGNLQIIWSRDIPPNGVAQPKSITVTDLAVTRRTGPPVFEEVLTASTSQQYRRLMPLIVYDLDGDGLSEIICGGLNRVFWNKGAASGGGGGGFELRRFVEDDLDIFDAAILADFTGDGNVDFVCVGRPRVAMLYEGDADGRFTKPGRQCAEGPFEFPKAYTAGDIDGDGDLDLFIAQYKFPYGDGAMPTPFYDANDGHPAYLLLNDGSGSFTDVTEQRGLAPKRHRRTYSASLIDLDGDGDLDLLTNNDFSGVDVYLNDGKGAFTDVTARAIDQRHMFGMAHSFADYNGDGKLDIYAIGMSSTTARRLERMRAGPEGREDLTKMRPAMGYGNRLYLQQSPGVYRQAPFNDTVARTGWSWGVSSLDFDNDGDKDLLVANGHTSGRSCRDYCSIYWRHDMYTGTSKPDPSVNALFLEVMGDLNRSEISWNGFEHKKLLMNLSGDEGIGEAFADVAYALGAAFEYDGRSVVCDDLDGDGRVDLLITQFENMGNAQSKYSLHVYRNTLETTGRWVGVRLREEGKASPNGAVVTVKAGGRTHIVPIVTGDSFSCQHPATAHFGLGEVAQVDSIEVRWPNGKTSRVEKPAVDKYHLIRLGE